MTDTQELYVGVDDGYMETKVALATGQTIRIPSHARAGQSTEISLSGQDLKALSYNTEEGEYVAGVLEHPDSTAFDDYPVSAMNRVIVTHALRQLGLPAGARLAICSGLPVKRFYKGRELNNDLIARKKKNLTRNDVRALPGSVKLHEIVRHTVAAEGVGAWMNFILERNENGLLVQNAERRSQRTAIVDVGGRTTDIAVIKDMSLDTARSSTIELGMLTVSRVVADALSGEFSAELNSEQIEQALMTGRVRVWSQEHDVSGIVDSAMRSTILSIQSEVKRRLGAASDIDQIVMVGGAIESGQRYFEGWYPNQVFPSSPGFANAMGFQKFAEMTMRKP